MTRPPGRPSDSDGDQTRIAILKAISCAPGTTRGQLCELLRLESTTLRFHLKILEGRGAIHVLKQAKTFAYYRRDVPGEYFLPLAALAQRQGGQALKLIDSHPGLNQSQLATQAAWSRKVVRRIVSALEAAGLVRRRPGYGLVVEAKARDVQRFLDSAWRCNPELLERLVEGRDVPEGPKGPGT